MNLKSLTDVELQFRVKRLLANYVQCIDEDRLEAWPDFFVDDRLYRIIAKENADRNLPVAAIFCDSKGVLTDRIVSLRRANVYERNQYRHIVSGVDLPSGLPRNACRTIWKPGCCLSEKATSAPN